MSRQLYYGYTSTAMLCGRVAACSGLGATLISRQRQLRTTAPTGSVEQTVKVKGSTAVKRGMHLQSEAGKPGVARWEGGNWDVTIKTGATGGNSKVAWENLFICRANAACTTFTTVASATGFSTALSLDGTTYSHTITGVPESNGAADDTLYVVLGFRSLSPLDQTVTLEMLATEVQTTIGNPVALTASLGADGSMVAATRRRRQRGASMSGDALMSAAFQRRRRASSSMSADASMIAGSRRRRRRGASMGGTATMTAVFTVRGASPPLASPMARPARAPLVAGSARAAVLGQGGGARGPAGSARSATTGQGSSSSAGGA